MKKKWLEKKLVEPQNLRRKVAELRGEKKSIATLNGSFDLLHAGHLFSLYEAAKQADILFVALNSDSSIKRYKAQNRPIIPLKERLEMVAAIECVDFVTWFDETDPCSFLLQIRPDVHANGEEYGEDCIEKEVIKSFGGRLHLIKRIEGLATSKIIEKIKTCG